MAFPKLMGSNSTLCTKAAAIVSRAGAMASRGWPDTTTSGMRNSLGGPGLAELSDREKTIHLVIVCDQKAKRFGTGVVGGEPEVLRFIK